jgi:hypothetical protein
MSYTYEFIINVFALELFKKSGEYRTISYQNDQRNELYKPWKFHLIWICSMYNVVRFLRKYPYPGSQDHRYNA